MRKGALEEGRRWVEQAKEDLKWAKELARLGGYHLACFLAQQVAEKALKGYLYGQGEEIVLGHSVERLCEVGSSYDSRFSEKRKTWAILDAYYVPTRYPNAVPDSIPARIYTESVAKEAVSLAEEVVHFVEEALGLGEL
jgi:HEPN domain-containing protein